MRFAQADTIPERALRVPLDDALQLDVDEVRRSTAEALGSDGGEEPPS